MNTTSVKQEKDIATAKQWLDSHKVCYSQLTPFHLKMGVVNFYPTTGKITIDGEPPYAAKGLQALLDVLVFTRAMD